MKNAIDTYKEKTAEAEALASRILATVQSNKKANKRIDWGHVGDMMQIANELKQISDRIHKEGELA